MYENDLQDEYDVIVVGSGASGGWAAKELTDQNLRVLILEAGSAIEPLPRHSLGIGLGNPHTILPRIIAMFKGQHIQARCGGWSPNTKSFFVNDRQHPYRQTRNGKFYWFRGRQVGGRLHTWARVAPRMSNIDFAAASLDGFGNNWPLLYEDLAPYYDKVEKFTGLYGSEDGIPHFPDGVYLKPWPLTTQEIAFRETIENNWPDRKVISARIMHQISRTPITLLSAKKTGLCNIRHHAIVKNIEVDSGSNKASGVIFIDKITKKIYKVKSRVIVLCASAFESIRILLNSKCSKHPMGIGNSFGLLGRGVMDNTFIYRSGHTTDFDPIPIETDPYDFGKGNGFFIPQYRNVGERTGSFSRSYYICGAIGRGGKSWWIACFGSMLPYPENRIMIDSGRTDAWGIPTLHIDIRYRENELAMIDDQQKTVQEMIDVANLKENYSARHANNGTLVKKIMKMATHESGSLYPGFAVHECGGAQMGADPEHSVLNKFNQCWDVPNIFVTDASCFASSSAVNPTNTIMALTVRACEHIAGLCASNEL